MSFRREFVTDKDRQQDVYRRLDDVERARCLCELPTCLPDCDDPLTPTTGSGLPIPAGLGIIGGGVGWSYDQWTGSPPLILNVDPVKRDPTPTPDWERGVVFVTAAINYASPHTIDEFKINGLIGAPEYTPGFAPFNITTRPPDLTGEVRHFNIDQRMWLSRFDDIGPENLPGGHVHLSEPPPVTGPVVPGTASTTVIPTTTRVLSQNVPGVHGSYPAATPVNMPPLVTTVPDQLLAWFIQVVPDVAFPGGSTTITYPLGVPGFQAISGTGTIAVTAVASLSIILARVDTPGTWTLPITFSQTRPAAVSGFVLDEAP